MNRVLGCLIVAVVLGSAPLLVQSSEGTEQERGRALFRDRCQFCHGIRGDGRGPAAEPLVGHPVDFTASAFWEKDVDAKIEETIVKGKEMMPPFHLNPDEIEAITRYMSYTFKKIPSE